MADNYEASPAAQAVFAAVIAGLCAVAALWVGWKLGWPASFDVDDVDFINPLSIMVVALLLGSVWFSAKALRWWLRQRAFGSTLLALDAPGYLRPGQALSGRLRVQRPVHPSGPYTLKLTCHDVHKFDDDHSGSQSQSFPVWSATVDLPATTDAVEGLPFRFVLPVSVGPDPVPSGILPAATRSSRVTIHIPGMRKVMAKNHPPIDRYWTLTATASRKGPDFHVEMAIPLQK